MSSRRLPSENVVTAFSEYPTGSAQDWSVPFKVRQLHVILIRVASYAYVCLPHMPTCVCLNAYVCLPHTRSVLPICACRLGAKSLSCAVICSPSTA